MRTCSVKRPCLDRIYNVQVVLRVLLTPRRGVGMGKESVFGGVGDMSHSTAIITIVFLTD